MLSSLVLPQRCRVIVAGLHRWRARSKNAILGALRRCDRCNSPSEVSRPQTGSAATLSEFMPTLRCPVAKKTRIIITDLTRFKEGNPHVCTAGVTTDGTLIRPYPPYLEAKECERLDLHPGAILEGKFTPANAGPPHVEDCKWDTLTYIDRCSSEEFREALESGLYSSISEGFEHDLPPGRSAYRFQLRHLVPSSRSNSHRTVFRLSVTDSIPRKFVRISGRQTAMNARFSA